MDDPQHPDDPDARRAEALDDAEDDALTATDVDPTGNAVRNDAVEKAEGAAHRDGSTVPGVSRAGSPWLLRDAVPDDHDAMVRVWRRAVEATHDFLTVADVDGFEEQVHGILPRAAIRVACDPEDGAVVGFLGARGGEVDMLFVDPDAHGRGAGTALLEEVAAHHPILTVDVNEQNPAARAWYRRRGFVEFGRSATDADGMPFPIVHLRRSTPP